MLLKFDKKSSMKQKVYYFSQCFYPYLIPQLYKWKNITIKTKILS